MEKIPITNEEYSLFSEKLAQSFETEISDTISSVSFEEIKSVEGLHLSRFRKTVEVDAIPLDEMRINSINFFSKTLKNGVFALIKHFRNCSSHKNRIFHSCIDGKDVIIFEDKNKNITSMRGIIETDKWEKAYNKIAELYKEKLTDQTNSNNNENKNS